MLKGLVFNRAANGLLKLSSAPLERMHQFAQDDEDKLEAGGVLLGRHIIGTNNIVVDYVTIPTNEDYAKRNRFFRSGHIHQKIIDQKWAESLGTCTYLGEWHTHPESVPTPSFIDFCNWRSKLLFDKFTQSIFFVIIGTKAVNVWEGQYRRIKLSKLEVNK